MEPPVGDELTIRRDAVDLYARTYSTVLRTSVADGFWTREQICTGAYASACQQAGL
jgi:hypothetical protein